MPRRSKAKPKSGGGASITISLGQLFGIGAALLGFLLAAFLIWRIAAGGFMSGGTESDATASLPVATYLDAANKLRGNRYRVRGTVEERLKWTPSRGRLISLDVQDGLDEGTIPILIPADFSQTNIDRGAEMGFTVRVARDGILIAEDIDRT